MSIVVGSRGRALELAQSLTAFRYPEMQVEGFVSPRLRGMYVVTTHGFPYMIHLEEKGWFITDPKSAHMMATFAPVFNGDIVNAYVNAYVDASVLMDIYRNGVVGFTRQRMLGAV